MDGTDTVEVVRPPFVLFGLAAAAAVAGAALLSYDGLVLHIAGYLLSSVICFLCAALFVQLDNRRAAAPVDYRPWRRSRVACTAVIVLGFVAACWHVWYVSYELAIS